MYDHKKSSLDPEDVNIIQTLPEVLSQSVVDKFDSLNKDRQCAIEKITNKTNSEKKEYVKHLTSVFNNLMSAYENAFSNKANISPVCMTCVIQGTMWHRYNSWGPTIDSWKESNPIETIAIEAFIKSIGKTNYNLELNNVRQEWVRYNDLESELRYLGGTSITLTCDLTP